MTLKALVSGLPGSTKDRLREALDVVYPGVVIKDLRAEDNKIEYRAARSNGSVVLVTVDKAGEEALSKVEGGLFSSGKYVRYDSDESLFEWLEANLEVSLDLSDSSQGIDSAESGDLSLDEETSGFSEDVDSSSGESGGALYEPSGDYGHSSITEYEPKGSASESTNRALIKNLHNQVEELESIIETMGLSTESADTTHELELLSEEKSALQARVSTLEDALRDKDNALSESRTEVDRLRRSLSDLEAQVGTVKTSKDYAEAKLLDLENSNKAYKADNTRLERELNEALSKVEKSESYISNYSDTAQVSSLTRELDSANRELDKVNKALTESRNREDALQSSYDNLSADLIEQASTIDLKQSEIDRLVAELESASEPDKALESLGTAGLLIGNIGINEGPGELFDSGKKFGHVMFMFSSNREYNTEAYRQLRKRAGMLVNSLREKGKSKNVLVADFGVDSFAQYVFRLGSMPTSAEWLRSGGDVNEYALPSQTIDGVNVYSAGMGGYLNEAILYGTDWESRIQDLENSDNYVIAYMGDLTSNIGRALYKSLWSNNIYIFGRGSVSGMRSLTSTLTRYKVAPKARIHLVDYLDLPYVNNKYALLQNKLGAAVKIDTVLEKGR